MVGEDFAVVVAAFSVRRFRILWPVRSRKTAQRLAFGLSNIDPMTVMNYSVQYGVRQSWFT